MNTTSESLLVKLQSSRDHQAWSRFVDLYTPLLFFWARKSGVPSKDAADLVQEVLAIVFQKLPGFQYDRQRSFRGWLRTITLNKYREWCRKRTVGAEPGTDSLLGNFPSSEKGPGIAETNWDITYQQSLVAQAMEILQTEFQPKTWQALQQFVLGRKKAAAIAEEAGLSVWTIYSAKSRLVSRLREELEGLLD